MVNDRKRMHSFEGTKLRGVEKSKRRRPRDSAQRTAQLYMTLGPKWQALVNLWTEQVLKCARCGQTFTEIDNIGMWKCSQHWWPGMPPEDGGQWRCCGKKEFSEPSWKNTGCIKADHTTFKIPFGEQHDVDIPRTILSFIRTRKKATISSGGQERGKGFTTAIRIRRFDWEAGKKKGRNSPFLIE